MWECRKSMTGPPSNWANKPTIAREQIYLGTGSRSYLKTEISLEIWEWNWSRYLQWPLWLPAALSCRPSRAFAWLSWTGPHCSSSCAPFCFVSRPIPCAVSGQLWPLLLYLWAETLQSWWRNTQSTRSRSSLSRFAMDMYRKRNCSKTNCQGSIHIGPNGQCWAID